MKLDRLVAAAFFLVGAVMVKEATGMQYMAQTSPGPGFYPLWLGLVIMGLAALMFVTARRPDEPFIETREGTRKMGLLVAGLLVYTFAVEYLGLIIALACFMAFILWRIERKVWRTWALGAVAISIGCYLLFVLWLHVPLPRGLLAFLG